MFLGYAFQVWFSMSKMKLFALFSVSSFFGQLSHVVLKLNDYIHPVSAEGDLTVWELISGGWCAHQYSFLGATYKKGITGTARVSSMGKNKNSIGPLFDTLKMERVRAIFTHTYPYPHEHSRHALFAVAIGCLFFISSDNMHTLIQELDKNIKWWSMYFCLFGFFYFFSSPFIRKTIQPSYSNFNRWYVSLIFIINNLVSLC